MLGRQNSQFDAMDGCSVCKAKHKANKCESLPVIYHKAGESQTSELNETAEHDTPIILDCGSSKTRAGFAGDETPLYIMPTAAATFVSNFGTSKVFGNAALKSSNTFKLSYPVEQGLIKNWRDVEDLFEYIIERYLCIYPPMHPVVVTEPLNNSVLNREKTAEMMFEKFNFNSFQLVPSTLMGMWGTNGKTGVVVESGAGQTIVVAVENGDYIRDSVRQIPLGGNDLSKYMGQLLKQGGNAKYFCGKRNELEILNEIKEIGCHVVVNFEEELRKSQTNPYIIPNSAVLRDGTIIELKAEAIQVPELLFKPEMINIPTGGIPRNIYECIQSCDARLRAQLYGNICLCGANTMFDGIVDRLLWEVKTFAGPEVNVKINAPANRDQTIFLGASFLGVCPKFKDNLISSQEYYDFGSKILQWKCI